MDRLSDLSSDWLGPLREITPNGQLQRANSTTRFLIRIPIARIVLGTDGNCKLQLLGVVGNTPPSTNFFPLSPLFGLLWVSFT